MCIFCWRIRINVEAIILWNLTTCSWTSIAIFSHFSSDHKRKIDKYSIQILSHILKYILFTYLAIFLLHHYLCYEENENTVKKILCRMWNIYKTKPPVEKRYGRFYQSDVCITIKKKSGEGRIISDLNPNCDKWPFCLKRFEKAPSLHQTIL